ncbi:hypothetical protein [Escherichia coli]|uniref:hypothetical protein n=1 Tax=Enterobacteriaceae TaxID=543 RepID=UPI00086D85CC|nr:hypothetical protein [Escherichia coli]MCW4339255.1 hypothetical protein [Klebsiella pneumoniae]EEY5833792.1 hypothetical protein [Escherichia coli]EFM3381570.1 hypothetical protein [Escherichia coli]EFN3956565.1 hypothetical protein [Escherichia coli]EHS0247930.1 hypothetical protein [Escherichia coli]
MGGAITVATSAVPHSIFITGNHAQPTNQLYVQKDCPSGHLARDNPIHGKAVTKISSLFGLILLISEVMSQFGIGFNADFSENIQTG